MSWQGQWAGHSVGRWYGSARTLILAGLAAAVSFAGSEAKLVAKATSSAMAFSGSAVRQAQKAIAAALDFAPSLASLFTHAATQFFVAMDASLSFVASAARSLVSPFRRTRSVMVVEARPAEWDAVVVRQANLGTDARPVEWKATVVRQGEAAVEARPADWVADLRSTSMDTVARPVEWKAVVVRRSKWTQ